MSDLHLDFHRDGGTSFFRRLRPERADVVALAGDIAEAHALESALTWFCRAYPHVVYVVGNHEYYHAGREEVHELLGRVAAHHSNFHWLHHSVVTLDGVRFLGTPLWFGYSVIAEPLGMAMLNDFRLIRDFRAWVYEEHRQALSFLNRELSVGDVLMTHHMPSPRSTADPFLGHPLNPFFVCDIADLIVERKPTLALHGHGHWPCDYRLGPTRVVANPLAYPGEHDLFDPEKTIEVGLETCAS